MTHVAQGPLTGQSPGLLGNPTVSVKRLCLITSPSAGSVALTGTLLSQTMV